MIGSTKCRYARLVDSSAFGSELGMNMKSRLGMLVLALEEL